MKKLLSLVFVLALCLTAVASADTLSVRVPYIYRLTNVVGEVPTEGLLMISITADSAFNAVEAHIDTVREESRAIYGEEIVKMLEDYKFFASAPVEVYGYEIGMGDMKVTLDTPYALSLEFGDPVIMVVANPTGAEYTYTAVEGMSKGDNKAEFTMPAELAAELPADGVILDFFAK